MLEGLGITPDPLKSVSVLATAWNNRFAGTCGNCSLLSASSVCVDDAWRRVNDRSQRKGIVLVCCELKGVATTKETAYSSL